LLHRWRSHLRMGAPGNIKWVLLFGLNRNERRSKQQSRESFRVLQMGSSLFSSRQRLNENGKESQNGEGIGVERRREAAVGLWNAVSAPLSLSLCVCVRGLCSHTHSPGSHSAPSPHRIPLHSSDERGCVASVRLHHHHQCAAAAAA
jgi:hypothetical protein